MPCLKGFEKRLKYLKLYLPQTVETARFYTQLRHTHLP